MNAYQQAMADLGNTCVWANSCIIYLTSTSTTEHAQWTLRQDAEYQPAFKRAQSNPKQRAFRWADALGSTKPERADEAATALYFFARQAPGPGREAFADVSQDLALLVHQVHGQSMAGEPDGDSRSYGPAEMVVSRLAARYLPMIVNSVIGADQANNDLLLLSTMTSNLHFEAFGRNEPAKMVLLARKVGKIMLQAPSLPPMFASQGYGMNAAVQWISGVFLAAVAFATDTCKLVPDVFDAATAIRLSKKVTAPQATGLHAGSPGAALSFGNPLGHALSMLLDAAVEGKPPTMPCDYRRGHGIVCDYEQCKRRCDDGKEPMKACSRCRCVVFCGVEHQRLSWKTHKLVCLSVEGGRPDKA